MYVRNLRRIVFDGLLRHGIGLALDQPDLGEKDSLPTSSVKPIVNTSLNFLPRHSRATLSPHLVPTRSPVHAVHTLPKCPKTSAQGGLRPLKARFVPTSPSSKKSAGSIT